jgi:hypothetical protein
LMMTGKSVFRFRFPEWTLWALPFAAHEVWHIALGEELIASLKGDIESANRPTTLLDGENTQSCLADAFATYTLGPAYAYAAIALLLDPARPADETRVCAILRALRDDAASDDEGPTESYAMIANELRRAWDAARRQAWASFPPVAEQDADLLAALVSEELHGKQSRLFSAVMDEVRKKWYAKQHHVERQFAPAPTADIEWLVSVLRKALRRKAYPSFTIDQWHPLLGWLDGYHKLGWATAPELPDELDLRHLLNAAWLARVDRRRPIDRDITDDMMELAKKINQRVRAKPVTTELPAPGIRL